MDPHVSPYVEFRVVALNPVEKQPTEAELKADDVARRRRKTVAKAKAPDLAIAGLTVVCWHRPWRRRTSKGVARLPALCVSRSE